MLCRNLCACLETSAVRCPFRVRFWRQFRITCISRSVEFRGKLWRSDFWWLEGLQSGALWRPQNADFTVSILTWLRSEIVRLSCAVALCGCMETSEEGFLVGDFSGHFSAADINKLLFYVYCLSSWLVCLRLCESWRVLTLLNMPAWQMRKRHDTYVADKSTQ
jgi:hypothetical protein